MKRPYEIIINRVAQASGTREQCMQIVVDALWDNLGNTGVSWVGFYLYEGKSELILGPRRNKPACSPIGLHGACGQAFLKKQPLVVSDVKVLGENYVACDPRDQSEIVIPMLDEQNNCWGVLDLDSHDIAAFTEIDVDGLIKMLQAAQLISHAQENLTPIFL
ncbi:MAG: GAF domain-containing protein [Gammaproteobacteria bacterium]